MPPVCHDYKKDSPHLSKKGSPGSTSSSGSTDSCFPNYTTLSLDYLNDMSSTASSSARGHSGQTFDIESAYTNESGQSSNSRVSHSDKKVKVKRAVEAPTYGTRLALKVFSGVNQRHGVSYNKKAGVFETPDVKIIPPLKTDKGSRADGSSRGVQVDEERIKAPKHHEMTPKSILRGHSVPTDSGYSTGPQSQQRRPTDTRDSKQQASSHQINGFVPVQRERYTTGDEYGDFDRKEMAAFNEVINHNYSQRGQRVDSASKKYEDHRSAEASSAQLAPGDRQRPQQRPTSDQSVKLSTIPQYGSSRERTTAATTPRNRSPDDIRGRSPTQRRPEIFSAKTKSYERTRPNDREHKQSRHDKPDPDYKKERRETVQGTGTTSPPQSPPPPPATSATPAPPPRLVYLHCGHPYIDDPSCKNAYQADPGYEFVLLLVPHPPFPRPPKFNAANLSDAALRELHSLGRRVTAPRWWEIKQHLHKNHPDDREEIGKMEKRHVSLCYYVRVHDHGQGQGLDTVVPPRRGSGHVSPSSSSSSSNSSSTSSLGVSQSENEGKNNSDDGNNNYDQEPWRWHA